MAKKHTVDPQLSQSSWGIPDVLSPPCPFRVPVLLSPAQPAPPGRPRAHAAAGARVRGLGQLHAAGVPEGQHHPGAVPGLPLLPAGILVLPGTGSTCRHTLLVMKTLALVMRPLPLVMRPLPL